MFEPKTRRSYRTTDSRLVTRLSSSLLALVLLASVAGPAKTFAARALSRPGHSPSSSSLIESRESFARAVELASQPAVPPECSSLGAAEARQGLVEVSSYYPWTFEPKNPSNCFFSGLYTANSKWSSSVSR